MKHQEFKHVILLRCMSQLLADFVAKVEIEHPKNLAKVDLRASLLLHRFSAPLGRSMIDFG
jgi:hypothetical protein